VQDLDLQECEINMRVSGISCAGLCFLEGVFLQTESSIFRHARDGSRVKSVVSAPDPSSPILSAKTVLGSGGTQLAEGF
jgi:hypothetical protein